MASAMSLEAVMSGSSSGGMAGSTILMFSIGVVSRIKSEFAAREAPPPMSIRRLVCILAVELNTASEERSC